MSTGTKCGRKNRHSADDALARAVREAVVERHEDGFTYVKSNHVVDRLEARDDAEDLLPGRARVEVAKRLVDLEGDVVERYSDGSGGSVWRVTP